MSSVYPCYGVGSALLCDDELSGIGATCRRQNDKGSFFTDLSKFNGWIDSIVKGVVFKDPAIVNLAKIKHDPSVNRISVLLDCLTDFESYYRW